MDNTLEHGRTSRAERDHRHEQRKREQDALFRPQPELERLTEQDRHDCNRRDGEPDAGECRAEPSARFMLVCKRSSCAARYGLVLGYK